MQIKYVLGLAAMLVGCHAVAATTEWDVHDPLETSANTVLPGSFTDIINFSLVDDTPLAVSVVANNLTQKLDIIGGTITLFAKGSEGVLNLGSYEFGGSSGDTSRLYYTVGPGDYQYTVKGYATGTNGGWYTLASTTLVPEPSPVALTLGSLMLMGLVWRRKNGR